MGKYKSCLVFIIGFCILCLVVQFDKKNAPGGREYNNYKDACEALDFQAAYHYASDGMAEYPEDYWDGGSVYQDNFDYVFNAEITYLCGLKTKEADDRIIHVLLELPSHGDAVDENVKYSGTPYYRANMYIEYIRKFNERCDIILEKAMLEGNKTVASKVLRLYKKDIQILRNTKEDDEEIIQTGAFTDAPKLAAQKKFEEAVADGAFDEKEDED